MADRRRAARRNQRDDEPPAGLSKEDEKVAKFIRFNCPTKTGNFDGNEVQYFTGQKAIDTLVDSKKYGANAKESRFSRRADAAIFLGSLLQRGYFFRARILVPKKKEDPRRPKKAEQATDSPRVRRLKTADRSDREGETGESGAEQKNKLEKDEKEEEEKKEKKKKKIKLVAHDVQTLNDDTDVYVWIFDPTPFRNYLIGGLMVVGTILACLFPLWPDWLRLGVYYLSVTGIALFGLLLGVAVARTIFFYAIYALTFGKHKLWILPNLTEDCGFFESFVPVYTYEYVSGESSGREKEKKKDKSKKKKDDEETEPLIDGEEGETEETQPATSTAKPKKSNRKPKRAPEPAEQPEGRGDQAQEQKEEEDATEEPKRKISEPSSSADDDYEIVGRER